MTTVSNTNAAYGSSIAAVDIDRYLSCVVLGFDQCCLIPIPQLDAHYQRQQQQERNQDTRQRACEYEHRAPP